MGGRGRALLDGRARRGRRGSRRRAALPLEGLLTGLVLDAGALVAIDRGDRRVGAMLRVAWEAGTPVRTGAPVAAQAWRGDARQARLARILAATSIHALDTQDWRTIGALLGRVGASDVVDAHLALMVRSGERVLTSDRHDLERLLDACEVDAVIVRV